MKLTIFNGSPRGQNSNTNLLLEQFLRGFCETPGNSYEVYHLNQIAKHEEFVQAYANAEAVLIGFPLYTDGMPGVVKEFVDRLQPFVGREGNPAMGFLVQSGFIESLHSRYVEKYLRKLAQRLGARYIGTIVKGGLEGIRMQPPNMTRKLFACFEEIGRVYAQTGSFDPHLLRRLAKPERISPLLIPFIWLLSLTGLTNFYWDMMLKENKAYDRRFAQPYCE
ncbi:MAG: hypothetical protein HPY45_11885 [Anaerolineae bacterium]|nr:hypothetical protein [Anaerolineae bacterium]